jgi:hypothetical protein
VVVRGDGASTAPCHIHRFDSGRRNCIRLEGRHVHCVEHRWDSQVLSENTNNIVFVNTFIEYQRQCIRETYVPTNVNRAVKWLRTHRIHWFWQWSSQWTQWICGMKWQLTCCSIFRCNGLFSESPSWEREERITVIANNNVPRLKHQTLWCKRDNIKSTDLRDDPGDAEMCETFTEWCAWTAAFLTRTEGGWALWWIEFNVFIVSVSALSEAGFKARMSCTLEHSDSAAIFRKFQASAVDRSVRKYQPWFECFCSASLDNLSLSWSRLVISLTPEITQSRYLWDWLLMYRRSISCLDDLTTLFHLIISLDVICSAGRSVQTKWWI